MIVCLSIGLQQIGQLLFYGKKPGIPTACYEGESQARDWGAVLIMAFSLEETRSLLWDSSLEVGVKQKRARKVGWRPSKQVYFWLTLRMPTKRLWATYVNATRCMEGVRSSEYNQQ
jgi:hypothetical protein